MGYLAIRKRKSSLRRKQVSKEQKYTTPFESFLSEEECDNVVRCSFTREVLLERVSMVEEWLSTCLLNANKNPFGSDGRSRWIGYAVRAVGQIIDLQIQSVYAVSELEL